MTKLIASLILVTGLFVTNQLQAQCNLPDYQWQNNKDRYVIKDVPFTSAVYLFQWKNPDSTNWKQVEVMLHAISSPNCRLVPGNNQNQYHGNYECTYTVGMVVNPDKIEAPGEFEDLWDGMQDGWEHRFAVKCGAVYSNFTPTRTVNF